jgi:hypothetical protein
MLTFVLSVLLFLDEQPRHPIPQDLPSPSNRPLKRDAPSSIGWGATDAAAGESRGNQNIQFNLIDNNALKDLNIRLGTNATIVTKFQPERRRRKYLRHRV